MPAAMSIWLNTQPPKIWPLALMSVGPGHHAQDRHPLKIAHSLSFLVDMRRGRWSCPLDELKNTRDISAGPEQYGEPDAEGGRDDQAGTDLPSRG